MSDTTEHDDHWIQGAVKHPGALRRLAEEEGGMTESGKIRASWLRSKAKESGTTGKRARLALTLKGLHH